MGVVVDRRQALGAGRFLVGLAVPVAVFYLLRAAGVSVYLSLLVGTLVSAAPSVVALVRGRSTGALSTFWTAMLLGSVCIAFVSGSTRFLLARDAVLTAATGVWFLWSVRAQRPLTFHFTRPLLEGRFHWPGDWDALWEQSPKFRRMWRVSSVMWGVGTLLDAAARVVLAYTIDPYLVPGVSTGLYVVTCVVLIVVTNVYYVLCGIHDRRSSMYEPV
jgi:hypothetical protein